MLPGRLTDLGEDLASMKEPLPFPEVPSSAFKNLASDSMRDEIMMEEDAAAALSAASKKVAPFLRGNVHKPVAASDASVRGTTPSISPAGSAQSWQEALRREGMIGPHPSLKDWTAGTWVWYLQTDSALFIQVFSGQTPACQPPSRSAQRRLL
ncbi:unnamed protein product [Durusdinium trenchii]|uniref:Uncharacterized protein n=1 Tax=Durusdinium trenchii TaxID=1381693 RepID=A0ABP0Q132_9DINO